MVTVPLVVVLGFVAWLMVKKGGWKFGPLMLGFALGLTMAATPFGPDLTAMMNRGIDAGASAVVDAFGGAR